MLQPSNTDSAIDMTDNVHVANLEKSISFTAGAVKRSHSRKKQLQRDRLALNERHAALGQALRIFHEADASAVAPESD